MVEKILRDVVTCGVAIYDCEVVIFIEELGAIGPVVGGIGVFECCFEFVEVFFAGLGAVCVFGAEIFRAEVGAGWYARWCWKRCWRSWGGYCTSCNGMEDEIGGC